MQLEIMLFFQRISSPILTKIANLLSFFGEEVPMIIIVTLIYWCLSKKKGFVIFMNLITSLVTMQALKAVFRLPRPFQAYPELIKGDRIETATGYSFPSGHSTGSSSFYSSLAMLYRNPVLRILCVLLIIGVPLSRLMLGVHWPLDVAFGTILGLSVTAFLSSVFASLHDNRKLMNKLMLALGLAVAGIAIILSIPLSLAKIDEVAFSDLLKIMSIAGFAMIGASIEGKTIDFTTEGSTKDKVLRFLFGIFGIILLQAAKLIIPESIYYIGAVLRYGLTGFWITYLMPLLSCKLGILQKNIK